MRIKLSVTIVGTREPVIAIDGESDQIAPLLLVARGALNEAEWKLLGKPPGWSRERVTDLGPR